MSFIYILFLLRLTLVCATLATSDAVPLLILKGPRSGSSWFLSLLNKLEGVWVTEEVVMGIISGHAFDEGAEHILKSFQHPMKKFPGGKKNKVELSNWRILGGSINPLNSWWVDLCSIPDKAPLLHLVAYIRTNKIKQAFSFYRLGKIAKKCHSYVVSNDGCKLSEKTVVHLERFDKILINMLAIDRRIFEVSQALREKLDGFYILRYEELINNSEEINKLLLWLGMHLEDFNELSEASTGRCSKNCTKATSDDLRMEIANYDEVERWIRTKYPCLLSQFYETRPDFVQPDNVYSVCGNLFEKRVSDFVSLKDNGTGHFHCKL